MNHSPEIEIHKYKPEWKEHFRNLNVEWLADYFSVTPEDEAILGHPEKIIEEGGEIIFVLYKGYVAGTCALIPMADGKVELIKMGVSPALRKKGIGTALMNAAIDEAKRMNAKTIFLETAEILRPAIALYT